MPTVDEDLAALGELDGVADEVDQDLAEAAGVADQGVGHVVGDVEGQLQALLVGPQAERPHRVAQAVAEVERAGVELELARLDLGEVEDVVDHRQEGVGRRGDHLQVLALLGRELGVEDAARSCR